MGVAEDAGASTRHHVGHISAQRPGDHSEKYGGISRSLVCKALLNPDGDEQRNRHSAQHQVCRGSLDQSVGETAPNQLRTQYRWNAIPVLDRSWLQPQQHVADQAATESDNDPGNDDGQDCQLPVPTYSRTEGGVD
jgi:hypothetical protein